MSEHSDGFTELVAELVKAFPNVSRVEQQIRLGPNGEQVVVCAVEFAAGPGVVRSGVIGTIERRQEELSAKQEALLREIHENTKPKFREFT